MNLTCSRLWGTRWPRRRAMWQHTPWRRRRASSASWGPPAWWRCRSGSGKSPACYRAARCIDRFSPHSAASYAESGLEKRRGDGPPCETEEKQQTPELEIHKTHKAENFLNWSCSCGEHLQHESWYSSVLETRLKTNLQRFLSFITLRFKEPFQNTLENFKNIRGCLSKFLKSFALWSYNSDCSHRMQVEWRHTERLEDKHRKVPGDRTRKRDAARLKGKLGWWRRDNRNGNRQVRRREQMKYDRTRNEKLQHWTLVTI